MSTTQDPKHGKLITKDAVAEKVPKTGPWAHMSCHRAYKGCGKLFRASLKQATTAKEVKSPCCNVMIPVHPLEPKEVTDPPLMPVVLPAPAGNMTQAFKVDLHLPPGTPTPMPLAPTAAQRDPAPQGEEGEPEPAVGAGAPNSQLEIETFGSPDSPTPMEFVGVSEEELREELRQEHERMAKIEDAKANAEAGRIKAQGEVDAAKLRLAAPPPPKKQIPVRGIVIATACIVLFLLLAGGIALVKYEWQKSPPQVSASANDSNDEAEPDPMSSESVTVTQTTTVTQTQTQAPTPTPTPTSSTTTSSSPPKPECPTEANNGITGVGSRSIKAKVTKDCSTVVNTGVTDSVIWSFTALDNSKLPDCVLVTFSNGFGPTQANAANQANNTFGPQPGNPLTLTFGPGCTTDLWVLTRN